MSKDIDFCHLREIYPTNHQFVIFKPLSYCFEETIEFDVKASFASRPVSRLIRWYNKKILGKGYSVSRDFSWIENYKLKYGKKLLDTATETELRTAKTASKKLIYKIAEPTGELTVN